VVVSLLGWPLLVLLCALAAGALALVGLLWTRWPAALRWPGRLVTLLLVMVMGAVLAGEVVNREYGLYSSFSELFAGPGTSFEPVNSFAVRPQDAGLQMLTSNWVARGQSAAAHGQGVLLDVRFDGRRSGISRRGLLYLPAAYFRGGSSRFPVVEFFHGTPGSPRNFSDQLHVGTVLDTEIAAGRVPPVVGLFPTIYSGHPSECVDVGRRLHDETYLAADVPADAESALRVLPGRSIAAVGYSTGGFCAVNLGLHHPDRFVAAGSLSGYFSAGIDPTTKGLFGRGSPQLRLNSPLWWVAHRRPTAPPLVVVGSTGDPQTVAADAAFAAAARADAPRLTVYDGELPRGGHNFATWRAALPPVLDWLAHYLPRDLAPPLTIPPAPSAAPEASHLAAPLVAGSREARRNSVPPGGVRRG
jgi:enterochelin esterase-like enzyme